MIVIFLFTFLVLVPTGKEYRQTRILYKKALAENNQIQEEHDQKLATMKELKSKNRHVLNSFSNIFNPKLFVEKNQKFFKKLDINEVKFKEDQADFKVYEVNAVSSLASPKSFYDFLQAINKSDYIIKVDFPINFVRKHDLITANFNIRVYKAVKDNIKQATPPKAK